MKTRNPNYDQYLKLFYEQSIYDTHKAQADEQLGHLSSLFGELHEHFQQIGEAIQHEYDNQASEQVELSQEFLNKWSFKGSPLRIKTTEEVTYQYFLDEQGRDYGQIIYHDKQVISMTEYDTNGQKLCYQENFEQGTINIYHTTGQGEVCDESKFRILILNGDLIRYGTWNSINKVLQEKMIQHPQTYNKGNYDQNYQKMLREYSNFNVVFLDKLPESEIQTIEGQQIGSGFRKTVQGFITAEGDSPTATVYQNDTYTFAQLKDFQTNQNRLSSYNPTVPYLLEMYPAQEPDQLSSTIRHAVNVVTPSYQSNMISVLPVTQGGQEQAVQSFEGEFTHYLYPSALPIVKSGVFNGSQKIVTGKIQNPFYELEGTFTEKGIFDMVIGKRTWFMHNRTTEMVNMSAMQLYEDIKKDPENPFLKANIQTQLEKNEEFNKFWKNGINIDPYRGDRLWEEGVFINGKLEGQGRYAFMRSNGVLDEVSGFFKNGEIVDDDGDWNFKKSTGMEGMSSDTSLGFNNFKCPNIGHSMVRLVLKGLYGLRTRRMVV